MKNLENQSNSSNSTTPKMTMDQLMASVSSRPLTFFKGQEVSGEVVSISDSEVTVDLGSKAEGFIDKRDFTEEDLEGLKVGGNIIAFVVNPENESGQVVLSLDKQFARATSRGQQANLSKKWQKFTQSLRQKSKLKGRVIEVNKGGLMVEVDGVRGFIPSSHIGLESIAGQVGVSDMVGQELSLTVLEVDPSSNRLIFSSRPAVSEDIKAILLKYEAGQKVSSKIAAIAPFGLFVDLDGTEGIVYSQEVAWEEVENLSEMFKLGQEIEAVVLGVDENLGRVNLSLKKLSEDPFEKVAEDYQIDDVVKGMITEITQNGVNVKLEDGLEGFVPAGKIEQGSEYSTGQTTNFLVDSIDKKNRRIGLAPFLTSTKGLIYK